MFPEDNFTFCFTYLNRVNNDLKVLIIQCTFLFIQILRVLEFYV